MTLLLSDDSSLESLGFFSEVGEALEDGVEHTADLAGADHVDVEFVEGLGVFCEGLGEGHAAFDVVCDGYEDVFEGAGFELAFEDFERADDGESGVLEGGELAGECGELSGADSADGYGFFSGFCGAEHPGAAVHFLFDAGGKEFLRANFLDGFFLVDGVDFALNGLSLSVHSLEAIRRHDTTSAKNRWSFSKSA